MKIDGDSCELTPTLAGAVDLGATDNARGQEARDDGHLAGEYIKDVMSII